MYIPGIAHGFPKKPQRKTQRGWRREAEAHLASFQVLNPTVTLGTTAGFPFEPADVSQRTNPMRRYFMLTYLPWREDRKEGGKDH